MAIPAGFGVWSATWAVVGTARNVTTTVGFHVAPGDVNAAPSNAAFRANTIAAGKIWGAALMPNYYSLTETKSLCNIGGFLFTDSNFGANVGSSGNQPCPINSALLVNKVTGIAGRKFRGRFFAPLNMSENDVDQVGLITPAILATHQARWDTFALAMTTAVYPLYILHTDGSAPTLVTSLVLSQRVGTIGRRMRG